MDEEIKIKKYKRLNTILILSMSVILIVISYCLFTFIGEKFSIVIAEKIAYFLWFALILAPFTPLFFIVTVVVSGHLLSNYKEQKNFIPKAIFVFYGLGAIMLIILVIIGIINMWKYGLCLGEYC